MMRSRQQWMQCPEELHVTAGGWRRDNEDDREVGQTDYTGMSPASFPRSGPVGRLMFLCFIFFVMCNVELFY